MFIFEQNGQSHVCRDQNDMFKAMGINYANKNIIMTDEQGKVVGAGQGGEALMKSMPIIAELRRQAEQPKQVERPLTKSDAILMLSKQSNSARDAKARKNIFKLADRGDSLAMLIKSMRLRHELLGHL